MKRHSQFGVQNHKRLIRGALTIAKTPDSLAVYTWTQRLDQDLWCIMEGTTKPVEGQNDGQETAAYKFWVGLYGFEV